MSSKENFNKIVEESKEFIENIFLKKYGLEEFNENSREDVYSRFERELGKYLSPGRLLSIMEGIRKNRIIPSGGVSFGLGNTAQKCSLSNCYFIPIRSDSIDGIYECEKELANTYKHRGGAGTDITILRPKNTPVRNAAIRSTGSVSFMPTYSNCVNTIGQNFRRGALIITMDIRHPDIIDFIKCKSNPEEVFEKDSITGRLPDVSGANISVKITNDFMKAVENDEEWTLFFPDHRFNKYDEEWDGNYEKWINKGYPVVEYQKINARDLLMKIAESAWLIGDPGVAFIDQVKKWSTGYFDEKLTPVGFNPCGEQPLADYNNCLLSAIVLYKYVKYPFTKYAEFDVDLFLKDVKNGIIFLDTLSDINIERHPLKEQREADKYGKRLGQEITGLADMWSMLGLKYGSQEACDFIDEIYYFKAVTEIETSIELAKEKGHAECFKTKKSRQKFIKQPYIQRILSRLVSNKRKVIEDNILKYGLRNSAFSTIGPTGTISIVAMNCTSGIEPLYSLISYRKTRITNEEHKIVHLPLLLHAGEEVLNLSSEQLKKKYNYVEAYDLDYKDRIRVQSTLQKWTDSAVSSTINLPNDANVSDIYNIYLTSYYENLKGITVFRDGSKTGVLSTSSSENKKEIDNILSEKQISNHLSAVKEKISGKHRAYRVVQHWKGIKIYVTITIDENEKPIEVFVNLPYEAGFSDLTDENTYSTQLYMERNSTWTSITRMISLALRANIPLEVVINQLKKASPTMVDLPAILLRSLKPFMGTDEKKIEEIKETKTGGIYCHNCGNHTGIAQSGCVVCLECGNSNCG
ncbi:MAG: adenosylcobalamin-dependent ribonucleoside-diphosphate reductase [bacterium]